ncbi:hypothetical protein ACIGBL_19895 [Streptomyces sp. NPDC085614]|uniref:hypothetical protein n=1 Tax=Streptomyces sp. NPDC085614 TaxID=3365733 RepID=UPI0037CFFAE4
MDIYEDSLTFPDPVTDSTKNVFVTYNPGRYDGVLVLVPNAAGFEDVDWSDPTIHYSGGRFAFYHAELSGPGESGRYTIIASNNSCNPSCAEGVTSRTTLHWNGHDYLPVE